MPVKKSIIVHGSPVIGADGTLYVINANRSGLYALTDIKASASPRGGHYRHPIEVRLKMNHIWDIYWRYKKPIPSPLWTKYSTPLSINSTKTIEFYGKNLYGDKSSVYSETYVFRMISP